MRQKVVLIAQDHMALHTAVSHRETRECRKQGGCRGKPPATPLAPCSETLKKQQAVTEIIAGSVPVSCPLDPPHIPYVGHLFPLENVKWIFPVPVKSCKRKKMFWKLCDGASLRSPCSPFLKANQK